MAGGFSNPYQSTTAIGTAFAGASARSDDASFFYYNPATISGLQGRQTYFDVKGFAPVVEITPIEAVSPLGTSVTADGGSGNMTDIGIAPGSTTAVPLGNGLTFGFSMFSPVGAEVQTSQTWSGRYQLLRSHILDVNATGAVSWQATPWLALAAGIEVERMENLFEGSAFVPRGTRPPIETIGYLKGVGWAAGPIVGIVVTPTSTTRIGLSWKSGLTHSIDGKAGANLAGFQAIPARYDFDLPSSFSAGLEQKLTPDLRVFAEARWSEWSRFKGFDISFEDGRRNEVRPVNWRDTWLTAIGFGYKVSPSTELTAGVSYDMSASTNGSGASVSSDANKIMIGTGISFDAPNLGLITLSYAHIYLQDAAVNASSLTSGSFTGTLSGHLDIIGAGYTYKW